MDDFHHAPTTPGGIEPGKSPAVGGREPLVPGTAKSRASDVMSGERDNHDKAVLRPHVESLFRRGVARTVGVGIEQELFTASLMGGGCVAP